MAEPPVCPALPRLISGRPLGRWSDGRGEGVVQGTAEQFIEPDLPGPVPRLAIPRKCGDLQLVDLGPDVPFFGPRSAAVRGAPPAAGVRAGRRPPAEAWR